MKLERTVKFERGHNCRDYECAWDSDKCHRGQGGFHGVHGMTVRFLVKGEKAVIQFVLCIPSLTPSEALTCRAFSPTDGHAPYADDMGYHAYEPQYEGQTSMGSCEYLDGAECYYDGSSLNADAPFKTLVNAGEEALWEYLEQYYHARFGDGEYPEEGKYPKPLRR